MNFGKYALATAMVLIMVTTSLGVMFSADSVAEGEQKHSFVEGSFAYDIIEGTETVIVYGDVEDITTEELRINGEVTHDGKTYDVVAVGVSAFKPHETDTKGVYWYSSVKSIVIDDGVLALGDSAFTGCMNITSIDLGHTVTMIGEGVFENDPQFEIDELVLPASLQFMGNGPFGACNIKKITVETGNDTFYVDEDGFLYGNEGKDIIQAPNKTYDNVTIKEGVEIIRSLAFYRCTIDTLTISSTVTSIDYFAFASTNIKTIKFADNSKLISIENYAFYECKNVTGTLKIPDSVINVGCYSFYESQFEEVIIGNSVKWVGDHAFEGHGSNNIKSLTIGNSVEMIGVASFCNCNDLSEVTIPASVKYICASAFYGSGTEKDTFTVTFKGDKPAMQQGCFSVSKNLVIKTNGWGEYTDFDYFTASGSKSVKINDGEQITYKGEDFEYQKGDDIFTCTINYDKTVSITGYTGLATNLVIPDEVSDEDGNKYVVTGISFKFANVNPTGTLTLPKTLTTINGDSFLNCDGLTGTLTIPANLYRLGTNAFCGCSGFDRLIFDSGSKLQYISGKAFDFCSGLDGDIIIPDSVGLIGFRSMRGLEKADNVVFGENVRIIAGEAMMYSNLTNLVFNDNLEYIGYYAFKESSLADDLTIPEKVQYIGTSAFASSGDMDSKTVTFKGDKPILGASSLFFGYNIQKEIIVKVVTNGWGDTLDGRVMGIFTQVEVVNPGAEPDFTAYVLGFTAVLIIVLVASVMFLFRTRVF